MCCVREIAQGICEPDIVVSTSLFSSLGGGPAGDGRRGEEVAPDAGGERGEAARCGVA